MTNAAAEMPPDFRMLFESVPDAYIVLTPDLRIVTASDAYLRATHAERSAIVGRALFDMFPENPDDPTASGRRQVQASLDRVRHDHVPDTLALQRYDLRRPAGGYEERYWSLVSWPVFGPSHELIYIIHRVENVTEYVQLKQLQGGQADIGADWHTPTTQMEAEIYGRVQEARAHMAAEAQRERLYRLFMQAPAGVAVLRGPNLVFELANPLYRQLVGGKRTLLGKPLLDAVPETEEEVLALLHSVYASGERFVGREFPITLNWDENSAPYQKFLNFVYEPLRDAHGRVEGILVFVYEVTDQVFARRRLAVLSEVSVALTSLLDYHTTLQTIARLVVPTLADFCFFDMVGEDQSIQRIAWAHSDPAARARFDQIQQYVPAQSLTNHPLRRVLASGVTEFVPEVTEEWIERAAVSPQHLAFLRGLQFHALMIVPIIVRDRQIGALTLCLTEPYRRYTAADRELAEELARRTALGIEHARLYAAQQQARAQAERRLAELTAVIDSIPDAVYIGNAGGINMCNDAALTMLGFDTLDDMNHDVTFLAELLQNRDAATGERLAVEQEAFMIALSGRPAVSEVIVRHLKTGADRILRSAAAPIWHDNQILGAVAVNTDITERKQAELERAQLLERERIARAEAEAAVRGRDEFLSVAAHELKTPVTSMRGYAQLLLNQIAKGSMPDAARLHRALDTINQQSVRLARFIDQLLDVSRIAAGRLALASQLADVGQLVREVVASIQPMTTQHTLIVSVDGDTLANVDPLRLEQVVTNLVTNAIKYSPAGGPVLIAVERVDRDWLRLSVTDRGIGIPPEHRAHIFERFYQAHGSGYFGGMGLGLSISQAIVQLHGGQLEAEFPDQGGTRMVVLLPTTPPAIT